MIVFYISMDNGHSAFKNKTIDSQRSIANGQRKAQFVLWAEAGSPGPTRYLTTTDSVYGDPLLLNSRRKSHLSENQRAHPASTRAGAANTLRIIGGQWRGRKLAFPQVEGLRPTGDRIRETLFNWLMAEVAGARCLDLFAGAGALGLEALSRGAGEVVMIDQHPTAIEYLRQHLRTLGSNRGMAEQANALSWLKAAANHSHTKRFDIVFIDPPFERRLWQETLGLLEASGLLQKRASIYIETPLNTLVTVPEHWHLHREKRAGQVCFRLYHSLTIGN